MIPTSTVSRSVEIGLRLTGIWPHTSILFKLFWTMLMGTGLIFQYRYLLTHLSINDLPDLIEGLSTTLTYSLLFFKLLVLWFNNRLFKDILTAMSKDWCEYSSRNDNLYSMISKAVLSRRCSTLIIGVYTVAVFIYTSAIIDFHKDVIGNSRQLLIKMEFPFAIWNSPIYEIMICVQFVHLMVVSCAVGVLNALIVTLILHIGGQIEIIHQQLDEICPKFSERGLSAAIVKSLINKHYKIIAFSDNVENLFTYIALMLFLSNTIIICCIGFVIVTSLGTDEGIRILIKNSLFYTAITMETFIFCFAGEYLSNKSKTIADAVYESLWYDLKPQDCRILLFVIMRSQRRLTITAGKFMDLSLERFTNSMKASASYVSVLYAMY